MDRLINDRNFCFQVMWKIIVFTCKFCYPAAEPRPSLSPPEKKEHLHVNKTNFHIKGFTLPYASLYCLPVAGWEDSYQPWGVVLLYVLEKEERWVPTPPLSSPSWWLGFKFLLPPSPTNPRHIFNMASKHKRCTQLARQKQKQNKTKRSEVTQKSVK